MKVKSLSRIQLLATPWTVAHQAPPFMGFFRQEYWSGVPLPSPKHCTDILKRKLKTNLESLSREGKGNPLQYSCLKNPMDGGAWWSAVHAVAKSRTRLSDFTFTFHFHALEKAMATHSSVLAWRIPGTGEPGGLPPMGSQRVGHD